MQIGEFFISLGVKGTEKTVGALSSVKDGLFGLKSMSLEAKAALLAAAYGFEHMMAASSKTGTELANFTALTGVSAKTLQQYQYAGRQVGISNEEMEASFKGVKKVMEGLRVGQAPEGLNWLTKTLGEHKIAFNPSKAINDVQYMMKSLQQYAKVETDVNMRNRTMASFGVGENMIAAMVRNAFRPEVLTKAPMYNNQEIGKLDKANAAWANLGNKVEMAFGHFNAAHGEKLVTDLSKVVTEIIKLVEAFMKLADALHLFQGIGKVISGLAGVTGFAAEGVGAITSPKKRDKFVQEATQLGSTTVQEATQLGSTTVRKATQLGSATVHGVSSGAHELFDFVKGHLTSQTHKTPTVTTMKVAPASNPITPNAIAPSLSKPAQPNSTQNNSINQTFHFQHDGSNHRQVGNEVQKAVTNAQLQLAAGGGI